ncbi:hypothetical protein [Halosimplex sp. J119]
MAANADEPNQGELSPCTDRQPAGESCGAAIPERETAGRPLLTPQTLYLIRIAMLEARVATLEARLESRERDLQHVVDRYERVLQGRDACRDEPLVSDEFDVTAPTPDEGADSPTGALGRLRGLLR